MTGCHPVEMSVCEHHVPIKFGCDRCRYKSLDKKIDNLEKNINLICSNTMSKQYVDQSLRTTFESLGSRLHKLEYSQFDVLLDFEKRIVNYEEQLKKIHEINIQLGEMCKKLISEESSKKPHKCPLCLGTRVCHSKETGLSWQCELCEGKGIVWG